jgi:TRAP-type C4-dicarboxylate transport system substrate-binding protein
MPFLAKDPVEARSLLQASWEQYQEAFARSNQVLLFSEPFVPGGIWSRNAVRTPEDLKGLRVRTFDANGTRVFTDVGSSPVQMTWSDVVTGLATGAVDAVLAGISPGLAGSFPEHIKHYNEVGYVMGSALVHMNRDVFEGLSDEFKKILMDTARQVEDEVWANVVEELKGDVGRAQAAGVTVDLEPQPELVKVLKDASAPVLEEWKAKMPAGVADGILERYRNILAEKQ